MSEHGVADCIRMYGKRISEEFQEYTEQDIITLVEKYVE